jgi:hypothetical protein
LRTDLPSKLATAPVLQGSFSQLLYVWSILESQFQPQCCTNFSKPQSISCLDTHQFSIWQLRRQTHNIRHEECSRIISVPWVADCMGKTPRGLNQSEQMTMQTADDGIHCEIHRRCTEDLLHLGLQNEQRIIEKPKCTKSFTQA